MTEPHDPVAPAKPESNRVRLKKQAKRQAILDAALREFTEHGFANARLSAVAKNAGVAKGTLYLYFDSKEKLFEGVVRESLPSPEDGGSGADGGEGLTIAAFRRFMLEAVADLQRSGRAGLALVVMTEGHRFPQLVEIYVGAVLDPILGRIAGLTRADDTPRLDALRRFPQLLVAPVVAGLLWNRFMTGVPAIDLVEIAEAQLSLLLADEKEAGPGA